MAGDTDHAGPRVSIVMPVFDAAAFLAESLASAAAQSYRDFEIVAVDDGSTDSRTRTHLAAAERQGVRVFRQRNQGAAAARNRAISESRGAYILPLDADDLLHPRFLERTIPVLDAEPAIGIVHTWVELIGGHHGVWRTGGFSVPELLARCTIHVSSLYRREIWHDIGGYDRAFVETGEDWDFWIEASARGWQARCVPEVLARYRRHAASRERTTRAMALSGRVMRRLVAKHRALYEANLDDTLSILFEHHAATCVTLERIYHHPVMRAYVRLRGLLRGGTSR